MADVRVTFVGSLLFLKDGNSAFQAVVPHADIAGARYEDGNTAKRHWPLLVIVDRSTRAVIPGGRHSIRGCELLIGIDAPLVHQNVLDGLIDFRRISNGHLKQNPNQMLENQTAAAVLNVRGGTLSAIGANLAQLHFNENLVPGHGYTPDDVVWRLDVTLPSPTVITGLPGGDLALQDPMWVFVGNFDEAEPTWDDLQPDRGTPWEAVRDDDFKWVYKLTTPDTGVNWASRLGGPDRELPLPEGTFGGGEYPTVGRCLGVLLS